ILHDISFVLLAGSSSTFLSTSLFMSASLGGSSFSNLMGSPMPLLIAGCEFLKKSEHLSHPIVDLISLFVDGVFKPLYPFGVCCYEFCLGDSPGPYGRGFEETALAYACGMCVELTLALVVIESKVFNDLLSLITELTTSGAVNFTFKVKGDMIVKSLDKPTINAMMRDFLE
nr:hypothetical protein [Tanacetum cinerariifolium]